MSHPSKTCGSQLGWWNSQVNGKSESSHVPVTTNQYMVLADLDFMGFLLASPWWPMTWELNHSFRFISCIFQRNTACCNILLIIILLLYIYIFFPPIHDLPYQIGQMVSTKSGVQGFFFTQLTPWGSILVFRRIFGIASFTGWWFQPLWKIWKSVGMMKFPISGQIKHVPNHQPDIYVTGDRTLGLAPWCTMVQPAKQLMENLPCFLLKCLWKNRATLWKSWSF